MKTVVKFTLFLILFSQSHFSFSMVEHYPTSSIQEKTSPNLVENIKPSFLQKIALKRFEKRFKQTEPTNPTSNMDKLANWGFWTGLLSIPALFLLATNLYVVYFIIVLAALVLSIIALAKGGLSDKAKKLAKWGLALACSSILLFLVGIALILNALGHIR
jgi:hypothetical protein